MMTITYIPTRTELVNTSHEIIPLLQARANWHEQHRRLHDETIEALAQAGIFKLRVPTRYGGYESDTPTLVEVLAGLGQGGRSTARVALVLGADPGLVGLFPDPRQAEGFTPPDRPAYL